MDALFTTALQALSAGRNVVLLDDAAVERGYLLFSAQQCTAETICFAINNARGLLFAPTSELRVRDLALPMMSPEGSAFDLTVSVEARLGVTTGISAADRAKTFQTLATTDAPRIDLVTPGHVIPWRSRAGGVLVRTGPAEAAIDLMELSGQQPVAGLCECLSPAGEPLAEPQLVALAAEHDLPIVRISEIVRHRLAYESVVELIAETTLPVMGIGVFRAITFRSNADQAEHLALACGTFAEDPAAGTPQEPILVRVQAEQGLPELFGVAQTRELIFKALTRIHQSGRGIFVFVRHPRKGLIEAQVRNLGASERKHSPVAVLREFGVGAQILKALGAQRIVLLGGAKNIAGLSAFQLEIVEQKPL